MLIYCFKNSKKVCIYYYFVFLNNLIIEFLDSGVDICELDIPVNAAATALKDFVSKRLPPLFEEDIMTELEDIAGKLL